MTHTYTVTGMTCTSCHAKVSGLLQQLPHVTNVAIDKESDQVSITMDEHIPTAKLQEVFKEHPKYSLSEGKNVQHTAKTDVFGNPEEPEKTWLQTYKPILIIAAYITVIAGITAYNEGIFDSMLFMRTFMAGFFLTFSFFKMLDLAGFAESYAMYDIVAMKFKSWGYLYAFIELALGIAFVINFEPVITNSVTVIVMSVSLIGVLQTVLNKKKIRCACLGAVFNLPMSTVTIIEDGLMILMSAAMLALYI